MTRSEFLRIRNYLDKTVKEVAMLLGISIKTVFSYEQGSRNIPVSVERQMLFLLAGKHPVKQGTCWIVTKCPKKRKEGCPAYQMASGKYCWFINGTICKGVDQGSWKNKMVLCRQCEIFKPYNTILEGEAA